MRLSNIVVAADWGKTRSTRWWIECGFVSDEDFDATIGPLSMLQVMKGARRSGEPADDAAVLALEGWILGQQPGPLSSGNNGRLANRGKNPALPDRL